MYSDELCAQICCMRSLVHDVLHVDIILKKIFLCFDKIYCTSLCNVRMGLIVIALFGHTFIAQCKEQSVHFFSSIHVHVLYKCTE